MAALTSFYMFRLVFVVFLGPVKDQHAESAHESPKVMTIPLVVLALFSAIAAFIGIESLLGRVKMFGIEHHTSSVVTMLFGPFLHAPVAAVSGLFAAVIGFLLAWAFYGKATVDPLPQKLGCVAVWLRDKFYFDEVYAGVIGLTHDAIATVADWFDRWIVSGLGVRGVHASTEFTGRALRLLQTGNLQTYVFLFALGVVIVLWKMLK